MTEQLRKQALAIKWFATDIDGVLTDGGMYYTSSGETIKKFHVQDGVAVELLRKCHIEVAFITSDDSPIIQQRAKRLKITEVFSAVGDKVDAARELCSRHGITFENLAYIGDDLPDLELLKRVGLAFAVGDAHPLLYPVAHYVCQKHGGDGAFREAAEWLITTRGLCVGELL